MDHGFLRSIDGSTYTTIDDPLGVRGTAITDINAAGDLVGFYYDSSRNQHAFIATPANVSGLVVTNTADSGPGSLRQAILYANANDSVPVTISFNIPTTDPGYANGVFTIQPLSQLPVLSQNITIDGSTRSPSPATPTRTVP